MKMGMEISQAISDLRIFSNFYECAETSIRFTHPTVTDCGFGLTLTRGEGSDPGTSSIAKPYCTREEELAAAF
jgi:hypothetical protein